MGARTVTPANTWLEVRALVDRVSQKALLYLKERPDGSPQALAGTGSYSNNQAFSVGANFQTPDFNGKIDELEITKFTAIRPGFGYFMQGAGNFPVLDVPEGSAAVVTAPSNCFVANTYAIPLGPDGGWVMIGNPFTDRVNLNTTLIRYNGNNTTCETFMVAADTGKIGNSIYWYNGTGYTPQICTPDPPVGLGCPAVVEPWKGYFMETKSGWIGTIELIVPKP